MAVLKINNVLKGRVVNLSNDGTVYTAQNYKIYGYDGKNLTPAAKVPCRLNRRLIEPFRPLCRLFRHEVRGFEILKDGSKIAATREGVYYSKPGQAPLSSASLPKTSLEIKPPMVITVDSAERILWGEYWGNPERREVRLFVSEDKGKSYELAFEFKQGDIKHIHNILEDPYDNCYWVCVGDHEKEPGIGRLSKDFKTLDWLVRGRQQYRAVSGFIFEDKIVYATDTEKDFNAIYAIDKASGKTEKLCDTPGSCIYSSRFGKWYAVSTSVEYFEKYKNNKATLWVSQDTVNWQQVYEDEKDVLSKKYFQFGSIVLPRGQWDYDKIVFSGQALKHIDNKVCIGEIIED